MKTLLTLILAAVCISLKSQYFFTTNNMMLFEFFISAIPSFVLSLQPNTNRVKGKFIPYVLSRAIPGALTLALGILSLYVVHRTELADNFGLVNALGDDTAEYQALMMLTLTFAGLVMLFRICQPFNVTRAVLFMLSAACCFVVVGIPVLGEIVFEGWEFIDLSMSQVLLVIIIVQACFPLSGVLIRFFDMINPVDKDNP